MLRCKYKDAKGFEVAWSTAKAVNGFEVARCVALSRGARACRALATPGADLIRFCPVLPLRTVQGTAGAAGLQLNAPPPLQLFRRVNDHSREAAQIARSLLSVLVSAAPAAGSASLACRTAHDAAGAAGLQLNGSPPLFRSPPGSTISPGSGSIRIAFTLCCLFLSAPAGSAALASRTAQDAAGAALVGRMCLVV